MSQDKYPLIKRCFPGVFQNWLYTIQDERGQLKHGPKYMLCEDLERELEKAVRVTGTENISRTGMIFWVNPEYSDDHTHTALLIGIEPIQKDTAESLLKELIAAEGASAIHAADIINRAKRLLEDE